MASVIPFRLRDLIPAFISVFVSYLLVMIGVRLGARDLGFVWHEILPLGAWLLGLSLVMVVLGHGVFSAVTRKIRLIRSTALMLLLAAVVQTVWLSIGGVGLQDAALETYLTLGFLHLPALLIALGLRILIPALRPQPIEGKASVMMSGKDGPPSVGFGTSPPCQD